MNRPPAIHGIIETALYVDSLDRAVGFYERVLGFRQLTANRRVVALDAGAGRILLFLRGASAKGVRTLRGQIPPHDGAGPAHVAFAIGADSLADWLAHLDAEGIEIESEVSWPRGGRSLYFRDPDDHSVELATPGVWEIY